MNYRLAPATPEDEVFLGELYADVHAAEFAPLNLPGPALAQMMGFQARAQRAGYAQQFPAAESSILWVGPYRVGRVLVNVAPNEIRLVDIALLSDFRGQGIGGHAIESLRARAGALGLPLRLSVRPGNPAARLYLRLGLVVTGGDGLNAEMEWSPEARPAQPKVEEEAPVVPGLSFAYFAGIVGQEVSVAVPGGAQALLRVVSVTPLVLPAGSGLVDTGDSFSIIFHSAADAPGLLEQRIHPLRFADGTEMEIFLGPIRVEAGVAVYEAVFNRTMPAPKLSTATLPDAPAPGL